jgi:hypothetical protein
MHLKSLLEVADNKDDDTEDDPALQEDDENERLFPGRVDAVDRTSGHVESCSGTFRLRQGSYSGMVCGEIPQPILFKVA